MNRLYATIDCFNTTCARVPTWLIALIGRFSVAAVFWKSGQTKVEGFAVDIIAGEFQLGLPNYSDSTIYLFANEYQLPLIPAATAALLATLAEHLLSVLLLFGLATRFAALGLLVITIIIQIFVYPSAYPTHGLWAAVLLYLVAKGAGVVSLDYLIARWMGRV